MSIPRGPARRTPLIVGLVLLNLVVLGGIAAVVTQRGQGPGDWWAGAAGSSTMDWDRRFAPGAGSSPLCEGCNVLMVSLDILRPDHFACLGYERDVAPRICELAAHGTLFENFITHAYQTPIAQMAMFTSRYPSSSGFTNFAATLGMDIPYLPEALKLAGYTNVAMGSSFEVMTDMSQASEGKPRFNNPDLNPGLSFGRGFDRFVFTGNRNVPTDAIPWIQQNKDQPFFLWLILGSLHWPYGAQGDPTLAHMFDPPGYDGPFADGRLGFEIVSHIYRNRFYNPLTGELAAELDDQDIAFVRSRYDFGLWTVDQFIGDLVQSIPPEVLQKTVIVLHGVHGEDLGEHGYFGHYDIYDTEVRQTLVVLNPRHRSEGVRVKEQVEGIDLAPTLLEVLGLPPLPGAEGHSFVQALVDGVGDPDKLAFFERIPLWEDIFRYKSMMPPAYVRRVSAILDREVYGDTGVRAPGWKLLHRKARDIEAAVSWYSYISGQPVQRDEWELYDLERDPTELHNVFAQNPRVAAELQDRLLRWEQTYASRGSDLRR